MVAIADVDAGFGQRRVIERTKSVEVFGVDLGGAVAAHEFILEEDAYFGDYRGAVGIFGGSYFDGGDEIFLAVGAQGADGELRAGEDDGFGEVLEHEAEGRGGVGHSVGAVQDDKAVEVVVVIVDYFDNLCPKGGLHIGRVDGGIELVGRDAVVEALQLGDMLEQVVEVEVLKGTGLRVFYHSDSSTCVNQEYGRAIDFHKHHIGVLFRAQRYKKYNICRNNRDKFIMSLSLLFLHIL